MHTDYSSHKYLDDASHYADKGGVLPGLAAARQLLSLGYQVVVLEGRSRPGGRVHTMRVEVIKFIDERHNQSACSSGIRLMDWSKP